MNGWGPWRARVCLRIPAHSAELCSLTGAGSTKTEPCISSIYLKKSHDSSREDPSCLIQFIAWSCRKPHTFTLNYSRLIEIESTKFPCVGDTSGPFGYLWVAKSLSACQIRISIKRGATRVRTLLLRRMQQDPKQYLLRRLQKMIGNPSWQQILLQHNHWIEDGPLHGIIAVIPTILRLLLKLHFWKMWTPLATTVSCSITVQ